MSEIQKAKNAFASNPNSTTTLHYLAELERFNAEMLEFIIHKYLEIKTSYKNVCEDEYQEQVVEKELKLYEFLIKKAGLKIEDIIK